MEEIVKIGKYYKIFSMKVNGIKYYFVGSIENKGFMWVYSSIINAIEKFEFAEDNAQTIAYFAEDIAQTIAYFAENIAQTIAYNENWEV